MARILHVLGEQATAVFPRAGYLGQVLQHLLDLEGVTTVGVPIDGETRQSHHVVDLETGLEYRFVLQGPTLGVVDRQRCLEALEEHAGGAEYVVLSGSLPPGVPARVVNEVASLTARLGARFVLDTSGDALAAVRGVYLMKPSVHELEALLGRSLEHLLDQVDGARCLLQRSGGTVVVLSRGRQGVVVVTSESSAVIPAHLADVVNTVGAGDALVAGTLAGLCRGWELVRAVRFGVACSAAMTGTVGTGLFTHTDLARFTDETLTPVPD